MERIIRLEGTITALSPIAHFGDEKTGSTPILRALTHWDPNEGRHVRIPYISGNAIRGVLRRLLMRDFLARLGYENKSVKLHHMLFTGGLLESTDETTGKLDLAFRVRVRDTIPPLALLGSAVGNQMLPGCLVVDHAMPICREYAAYIPDVDDPRKAHSVRTFTDVPFATRRDDLRAEREEDEQAMQMKVEFECFITGAAFVHGFGLRYANEVEVACLGHVLALWAEQPFIGGKAGSGHGRIRALYQPELDPVPYIAYLESHREFIVALLDELAGKFERHMPKAKPEGLVAGGLGVDAQ